MINDYELACCGEGRPLLICRSQRCLLNGIKYLIVYTENVFVLIKLLCEDFRELITLQIQENFQTTYLLIFNMRQFIFLYVYVRIQQNYLNLNLYL